MQLVINVTGNTDNGIFSYFQSIINYEVIFWRNSIHSTKISRIQKNIIRDSSMDLFKKLNVTSSITITVHFQFKYLWSITRVKTK